MTDRAHLLDLLGTVRARAGHRPWPRFQVTPELWLDLAAGFADGRFDLMGLFAEDADVLAVAYEPETQAMAVAASPPMAAAIRAWVPCMRLRCAWSARSATCTA